LDRPSASASESGIVRIERAQNGGMQEFIDIIDAVAVHVQRLGDQSVFKV
jgi:hypothetical protein